MAAGSAARSQAAAGEVIPGRKRKARRAAAGSAGTKRATSAGQRSRSASELAQQGLALRQRPGQASPWRAEEEGAGRGQGDDTQGHQRAAQHAGLEIAPERVGAPGWSAEGRAWLSRRFWRSAASAPTARPAAAAPGGRGAGAGPGRARPRGPAGARGRESPGAAQATSRSSQRKSRRRGARSG